MQYFTQVDCSLLFCGYGLHYNTRSKRFSLYCPGGRYAIFYSGLLFTLFYKVICCNIIKEVKGLRKKLYFVLLSRRKTSFYAKFVHIVFQFVHGCGLHYNVTISKTGSKRVNDKLHSYALPRKKTGLLANIRVQWCYG